tara:strand:- start:794 stop:1621 length:828 start_codon:yes stop_codon:yes gene_type:complete
MKTEIIAEIGWNHMGNMSLAKKMIIAAKKSGANTAKFQYWNPANLKKGPWDKDGRRQIYNKAFLDEKKISLLKFICKENKINFLISIFGSSSIELMKKLKINNIKIPSHEVGNKKLILYSSKYFSKIYFSTGASEKKEIINARNVFKKNKNDFLLMHCVSSYPCLNENINLPRITWLKTLHKKVGLSDHTSSTLVPSISVSMGASVIEKHFTTDNSLPGRDNKFALTPFRFKEMVDNIRDTEEALVFKGLNFQKSEKEVISKYRGRWEPTDYLKK